MKGLRRWLGAAAVAAVVWCAGSGALAQEDSQGPGEPGGMAPPDGGMGGPPPMNFDPAQMAQRMLDRYKDALEITNAEEWAALKPLAQKVMDARMAGFAGGGPGMFGPPRRGNNAQSGSNGQASQRRDPMGPATMPEAEALRKVLDAKGAKAQIKAALDKFTAARQAKQAELQQAQENLRKVLTSRQEALAALSGLL